MTIDGPVVLDIVQHFVERWNEVKTRKVCTLPFTGLPCALILALSQKYKDNRSVLGSLFLAPLLLITFILSRFDWLALPHNVDAAPNEAVVRHPQRENWHQVGRHFKQRFHRQQGGREQYGLGDEHYSRPPHGTCRVQVVRSVSDWSHGVLTEHSIQNACERKSYSLLRARTDKVLQIYS